MYKHEKNTNVMLKAYAEGIWCGKVHLKATFNVVNEENSQQQYN